MARQSLHDWLRPRLQAALREAIEAGYDRDAAVAVMIDIVTGQGFDDAPPPAEPATPTRPGFPPPDPAVIDATTDRFVPDLLGGK